MSDEPLYCTRCGAEDWDCEHGIFNVDGHPKGDDGHGPFCEVNYHHVWPEDDPEGKRCLECGCLFGDWVTEEQRQAPPEEPE